MRAKYVVVNISSECNAFDTAICFPEYIGHNDMARRLNVEPDQVISAGFFTVSARIDGRVVVDAYGESVSLSKRARMEDSKLIAKSLGVARQ